jgi:hypothetical protein
MRRVWRGVFVMVWPRGACSGDCWLGGQRGELTGGDASVPEGHSRSGSHSLPTSCFAAATRSTSRRDSGPCRPAATASIRSVHGPALSIRLQVEAWSATSRATFRLEVIRHIEGTTFGKSGAIAISNGGDSTTFRDNVIDVD